MTERMIVEATKRCGKKHGYASVKRDSEEGVSVMCSFFPYGVCEHPNDDGQGICDLVEIPIWKSSKRMILKGDCKAS